MIGLVLLALLAVRVLAAVGLLLALYVLAVRWRDSRAARR